MPSTCASTEMASEETTSSARSSWIEPAPAAAEAASTASRSRIRASTSGRNSRSIAVIQMFTGSDG